MEDNQEFKDIRDVLRVPFPEDMMDLAKPNTPKPDYPIHRQWYGPCLGYQLPSAEKKIAKKA